MEKTIPTFFLIEIKKINSATPQFSKRCCPATTEGLQNSV